MNLILIVWVENLKTRLNWVGSLNSYNLIFLYIRIPNWIAYQVFEEQTLQSLSLDYVQNSSDYKSGKQRLKPLMNSCFFDFTIQQTLANSERGFPVTLIEGTCH